VIGFASPCDWVVLLTVSHFLRFASPCDLEITGIQAIRPGFKLWQTNCSLHTSPPSGICLVARARYDETQSCSVNKTC
jgi:hypothetical protein